MYASSKRVARNQLRSQSNLTDLPATVLVIRELCAWRSFGSRSRARGVLQLRRPCHASVVIDYRLRARQTDKRDGIDVSACWPVKPAAPTLDNDHHRFAVDRALHELKERSSALTIVELRYFAVSRWKNAPSSSGISMAATCDWRRRAPFWPTYWSLAHANSWPIVRRDEANRYRFDVLSNGSRHHDVCCPSV